VFDIVDRQAVAVAIDGFLDVAAPVRRQLYGVLTAAIWLGGNELTVPPPAPPPA
jgi:hypothetical protein